MTTSKSHIEKIQARLSQVASREQLLIEALGEALSLADKKLLDDVRSLTIEHETRRALILSELQALAARIGAFPASDDGVNVIENDHLDLPYYAPGENPNSVQAEEPARGGDWRQAAKNIGEALDLKVNGHRPAS